MMGCIKLVMDNQVETKGTSMQTSFPVLEQNNTQDATTLHILSNFAIGQTTLNDSWCEQITSLRQRALAFQAFSLNPVPSITRTTEAYLHGSGLFNVSNTALDIWPTWCSFLTSNRSVCESFLLLSIVTPEMISKTRGSRKYQLVFRFHYPEHLALLESIKRARKLVLRTSSPGVECVIPFYEPELANHLEYIRPLFR